MRRLGMVVCVAALSWSCSHGTSDSVTGPSGAETVRVGGRVSAPLANRFLYDHNAVFNEGRTFRWVPPIPIYILGPDPSQNDLVLQQFLAWESALAGVGGTPFYAALGIGGGVPRRGILFQRKTIEPQDGCGAPPPGVIIAGCSNPFLGPTQPPQFPFAEQPQRSSLSLPEVTAGGEITTCVSQIDSRLGSADSFAIQWVIRHEIGRCLGFVGFASSGVMQPICCPAGSSLAISSDVAAMMRTLYGLSPGTTVGP